MVKAPDEELVPYAPDFTPATLGKVLGAERVLQWLLDAAASAETNTSLQDAIAEQCLSHIARPRDRRDMASHVVQGLRNYKLVVDADGRPSLTAEGEAVRNASEANRAKVFARHIICSCNGFRLLEAIRRYEQRGQVPSMEDLARELDRHATSKSISSMRAWLELAGIFPVKKRYSLDEEAVKNVLGSGIETALGLTEAELEFLLAARLLQRQTGEAVVRASEVADIVDHRSPATPIPRKGLGPFVKSLEDRSLLRAGTTRGKGGTARTIELTDAANELSDGQFRSLIEQSQTGFPLEKLRPMAELVETIINDSNTHTVGVCGEMLAVHLCLALGLRVSDWRKRAPEAEIDLLAERTAALTYQRWAVQVKTTISKLDSDRVDREVGAVAGSGVTHILFILPVSTLTGPALAEIMNRNRLTSFHLYYLTKDHLVGDNIGATMMAALTKQELLVGRAKKEEAERREGAS
jgi:hypothetical protein